MNDILKPGKLGNPDATFITDPRADPRIKAVMQTMIAFGDGKPAPGPDASYEECVAYSQGFEAASAASHALEWQAMPAFDSVLTSTQVIPGDTGHDIQLYLHLPKDQKEPGPGIVHFHGGGMVLMTAADPSFVRWRNSLAAAGMRVIGVEFRNGGGSLGNHPFPAGLNDCASAVNWVHAHRDQLGISTLVLSGESGGGNLSLATALKARQEGWLDQIKGVYALCPYISGSYGNPPLELVSLRENDGYSIDSIMMATLAKVYNPNGSHDANPLAWPLQASLENLQGLPPHVISVNELDPLRDEGLAYYRKLMAAGVPASARTVHGTPHAGDLNLPDVTPDLYQEAITLICRFARSLN